MYFEMVIFNNLINSEGSLFVGILLLSWGKEFIIIKGSFSREAHMMKANTYAQRLLGKIIMLSLMLMFPNSLSPSSSNKITFYFLFMIANLGLLTVYYYIKSKGAESPFEDEYKRLKEFFCIMSYPVVKAKIGLIPPISKRNTTILNLEHVPFWTKIEMRTSHHIIPICNVVNPIILN